MKTLLILLSFLFIFNNTGDTIIFPEEQGWKLSTDFPVYTPDNLWDYINGAADGYLSFGFQDLTMAEYTKGNIPLKLKYTSIRMEIMPLVFMLLNVLHDMNSWISGPRDIKKMPF